MANVGDLMGDHATHLVSVEAVEQAGGDADHGMTLVSPGRERVRLRVGRHEQSRCGKACAPGQHRYLVTEPSQLSIRHRVSARRPDR